MGFSFMGTILKILVTYGCIYWNQDKLNRIMTIFPERFTLEETKKHKIDKKLMWIKIFVKGILYHFSTSFILLIGEPIKEYFVNHEKIFPFHIVFPFNTEPCYVYYPLFLWIIISHALHIILMAGNYNVMYGFVTLLSIEFDMLKEQFRELQKFESKEIAEKLKDCINKQNELREVVEEFQKIFTPTLFIKLILSSFLICASVLQCSTAENILNLLFHLIFCVFTLNQVFILCFFGQILKNSTENVADGIYNCGWENFKDNKLRFSILMALREAQKNSKLTVLNISTISLDQFKTVS
jgi:gustatory receptor